MKKAKTVEIPTDRPLTSKEYAKLKDHAYNSALWYASEHGRNSSQIKDKLVSKGYILDDVEYVDDSGVHHFSNIVDEVLQRLQDNLILDDERYARRLFESYLSRNRGSQFIKMQLKFKGVEQELIDLLLEEYEDEEASFEALDHLAERYVNTSTYLRTEGEYKRKAKLTSHLVSRGFNYGVISDWFSQRED